MTTPYPGPRSNLPIVAALSAAVALFLLIVGAVVILAMGKRLDSTTTPLIITLMGVVISGVPALIAAAFSERASKDIRNGTLVAKAEEGATRALMAQGPTVARQGATEAIEEAQVMTRTGPVVTAELTALTAILDRLTTHAESTPPPITVHVDTPASHPPEPPA